METIVFTEKNAVFSLISILAFKKQANQEAFVFYRATQALAEIKNQLIGEHAKIWQNNGLGLFLLKTMKIFLNDKIVYLVAKEKLLKHCQNMNFEIAEFEDLF